MLGTGLLARAEAMRPEDVPAEFVKTWNAHESVGFEKLFTEDAVWVPVAETRDEGREQIVKDLMAAHTTWAKRTKIVIDKDHPATVRLVRPEVATVFFRMKFLNGQDQPIAGLERAMVIVAVNEGGTWKISAGQLTKESAPRK